MNTTHSVSGHGCFLEGLQMLLKPELRGYVIWPLLINVVVFSGIVYWSSGLFSQTMDSLISWLPDWLAFLEYLFWPLFFLMMLAIVFFTFTLIGNLIAAPFNALLSEKVQQMEGAKLPDLGWKDFLAILPRSILRELRKIAYFLPRALILLLLSFIPVVGAVLWFIFNGWMMAIQYCDYPADNRGISFSETLAQLKKNNPTSWFFGTTVNLVMLIPLVNLVMIPAGVVGATLLWERKIEQQRSS